MPDITALLTKSGFSNAVDALASPISPRWSIAGIAQPDVLNCCALDSTGEQAALCPSGLKACIRTRASVFWARLPTMKRYESRAQAIERSAQTNIVLISGGSPVIGLPSWG